MPAEITLFTKNIIRGKNTYYLEYIILEKDNHYGIKIKSTLRKNTESEVIFPIQLTKEETLNFMGVLSRNLVFPISLPEIYEDYIYD